MRALAYGMNLVAIDVNAAFALAERALAQGQQQQGASVAIMVRCLRTGLGRAGRCDELKAKELAQLHAARDPFAALEMCFLDRAAAFAQTPTFQTSLQALQQLAAQGGDAHAMNALGICYGDGLGVPEVDHEAEEVWFGKAAALGHAGAQVNLANCYFASDADDKRAIPLLAQASAQGHASALYRSAMRVLDQANATTAQQAHAQVKAEVMEQLERADAQGLLAATLQLAACHRRTDAHAAAYKLYAKAAECKHPAALYNAAICLQFGLGTLSDEQRAETLLLQAAQLGHADAQCAYGDVLLQHLQHRSQQQDDQGHDGDVKRALQWIERAAEQKHVGAMLPLACRYFSDGPEQDKSRAVQYFRTCMDAVAQFPPPAMAWSLLPVPRIHVGNRWTALTSNVYRAELANDMVVAVKTFKAAGGSCAFRELIAMLAVGTHRNIVRLLAIAAQSSEHMHRGELQLITELAPRGSLESLYAAAQDGKDLSPQPKPNLLNVARDVACGLAHMHARRLVHRDLCARNVVWSDEGCAQIIDFGLAAFVDVLPVSSSSSTGATAPPALADDVFAYGLLLEDLANKAPATSTSDAVDGRVRAVISACLQDDRAARPTAQTICSMLA